MDIAVATCAILQYILHRLQDTSGVLAKLMDRSQVPSQHIQHVQRILIVVFVDLFLVMIDILLEIYQQVARHFGVVDNIVHGVEDAVDKSLGQFTHSSHLLLTNQLVLGIAEIGCAFLYDALQFDLVPLQPLQAISEQQIDHASKDDEVKHQHIPAHQQRIGNAEINGSDLRQFPISQLCLYGERKHTVWQIQELYILLVGPCTPTPPRRKKALIVQTVTIERLACQRCIIERIEEMQMSFVAI